MEPHQNWAEIWRLSTGARQVPLAQRSAFVQANSPDPDTAKLVIALLQDSNLSIAESTVSTNQTRGASRAGLRIGRYVVGEILGSGAFADVHAARDTELDRPVALKFLRAEALDPRWTPARFLSEAKATSALNHPHIVTVHEVIHSPAGLVIAMEFIEGAPLRALCLSPRPAPEVVRHGVQIAKALAAAHSRGVIHRDIKPENIMLRTDGYVKVVDFGLARDFGQLDRTQSAASIPSGTLRYMSPEQTAGKRLTTATDVFSLGLVLYELAGGAHPFAAATAIETAYNIGHQPPRPLPVSIPPMLEPVLLRLLAKAPEDRPTAAEAAELLEAALMPKAAVSPLAAHRRWASIAGAAALLIGGAVAWRVLSKSASTGDLEPLNIVNVTSLEGYEWGTSFSPDGGQIAFAWDGGPGRQQGIYTQPVAGGAPARVSRSPGEDFYPSWSPDGARIAFVRRVGKGPGLAVMIAPAGGGGSEQRVTEISENEGYPYPVAWHPDGNSLLVRTVDQHARISILRQPLDGSPRTPVTSAGSPTWDGLPTPAPSGKKLAFSRSSHGNRSQVCVQELTSAAAKCFASGPSLSGLAWANGERSVYVGHAKSLSRLDLSTGAETKIGDGPFNYLAGDRLGKQFAFSYTHRDHNIWRFPTAAGQLPAKWIASSDDDIEPAYSPDGQSIVFRSKRSGVWEFWTCRADGSEVRQLTRLKGAVESPRWSPDGRRIALWRNGPDDRFVRIYVVDINSGDVRPVTPDRWPAQYPIWSAKGDSILFSGGDPMGIWSIPADGSGPAVRIASTTWLDAFASGDGQWIYFTKGYDTPGVWRMPVSGGREPDLIAGSQGIVNYRYWDVAGDTAYFADIGGETMVRSLDLKTGQTRPLFPLQAELFLGPRGFAVSGDGKSILIVKLDTVIGDIRMIEGLP